MNTGSAAKKTLMRSLLFCFPGTAWVLIFLIGPMIMMAGVSFYSTGTYGEIERPLTLEHYARFAGFGAFGFDPLYPLIIGRSMLTAAIATALCFLLALPIAVFMSMLPARWKTAALVLVTVPLWTNLLIRTYAWQILLAPGNTIATAWQALGGDATLLYPGTVAVYIGLVCDYLPFLVLPLYASIEKIDWSLAEAAQDLGAGAWQSLRHAIWPQIAPGARAGIVLVFVPAIGQFVIPDLLGGSRAVLLGNVIQQQFGPSNNWPFGSAVATATSLVVLAGLWAYARSATTRTEALLK